MRRLPLVHALGAALIDHALGVAEDKVLVLEADGFEQFQAGDAGGAGAVADNLGVFDLAVGEEQRIEQARGRNDRGAVLVVMEHGNVHEFAQPLLDDEALRSLDVLEVDAAPAGAEQLHAIDDLVGFLGGDAKIDGIDVGEALEQHGLAFHHRLCRQRAAVAEPEDGRAIGDDGDEVAFDRVVVGLVRIVGDGEHRDSDARRVGQRQIALRRHRLGGDHLELAGASPAVKVQRLLIGESRPVAVGFLCHFNTLPPANRPLSDVSGMAGPSSRHCRLKGVSGSDALALRADTKCCRAHDSGGLPPSRAL